MRRRRKPLAGRQKVPFRTSGTLASTLLFQPDAYRFRHCRNSFHPGHSAGCVRDGGTAAPRATQLPADQLVLPAHLDPLSKTGRPHSGPGPAGEFSWLLRTALADFPADFVGSRADLRFCPAAIWSRRTLPVQAASLSLLACWFTTAARLSLPWATGTLFPVPAWPAPWR